MKIWNFWTFCSKLLLSLSRFLGTLYQNVSILDTFWFNMDTFLICTYWKSKVGIFIQYNSTSLLDSHQLVWPSLAQQKLIEQKHLIYKILYFILHTKKHIKSKNMWPLFHEQNKFRACPPMDNLGHLLNKNLKVFIIHMPHCVVR